MITKSGFTRPRQRADSAPPTPSAVLYVANCGTEVGMTDAHVPAAFGAGGRGFHEHEPAAAEAAMAALHGRPCDRLAGPRAAHTLLGACETQAPASSSLL
jgi:alkylated DNA repair protein alkB homolog 8